MVAAAISIIGISLRSAKGDHAARTSSAAPAIICSNGSPLLFSEAEFVIAAVARLRIATITNFERMIAISSSTSLRAQRLAVRCSLIQARP